VEDLFGRAGQQRSNAFSDFFEILFGGMGGGAGMGGFGGGTAGAGLISGADTTSSVFTEPPAPVSSDVAAEVVIGSDAGTVGSSR